jgi:hypothetical protein
MNNQIGISIFCFDLTDGLMHNRYAVELVRELISSNFINIHVLTDRPELFGDFNINTIHYSPKKHSYFDKLTICKEALKHCNQVLYIDCDSRIDLDLLKTLDIKDGLTVSKYWHDGGLKEFKDLSQLNTNYFNAIKDYCLENKLHIDNVPLFEDRLFTLSNIENIDRFFEIFFSLKNVFEINDEEFNHYPVGRAEGLAMSIAACNSGIKYDVNDPNLNRLNLKHLPNN